MVSVISKCHAKARHILNHVKPKYPASDVVVLLIRKTSSSPKRCQIDEKTPTYKLRNEMIVIKEVRDIVTFTCNIC